MEGYKKFCNFFLERYREELKELLQKGDRDLYYSFHFNFKELLDFDCNLADYFMLNPDIGLEWAETGLFNAQESLFSKVKDKFKAHEIWEDGHGKVTVKKAKPRLDGNLMYENMVRPTVSDIRSADVDKIIQIRGTVIRQSKVKLMEISRDYRCQSCGYRFTVYAEKERDVEFPKICRNGQKVCKSKKFQPVPDSSTNVDYQDIHVQEQIHKIGLGKIPRSIRVVLTCDLADSCQPGDDVGIIGQVRYHWSSINLKKQDSRFDLSMYIEAISLKQMDNLSSRNSIKFNYSTFKCDFDKFWSQYGSTPIAARNMILANLSPQLCGMFIVKLAVALTIIGGCPREEHGTRIRGQSHLLLIGDPGTGKSQLLRYAARMSTRSVLTTGVGTTSAGLTVSAVKDGGEWILEAGALVLADGGICCIDEFGSVREHDRGVIHEAMEQQTISVAKGGFVCSLNSRATVLAAMNPPSGGFGDGKAEEQDDLSKLAGMASSLLSRFDVMLLLLDAKNDEWDRKVGQHLMDNICEPDYPDADYLDMTQKSTPHSPTQTTPGNDSDDNTLFGGFGYNQPAWTSTAAFERDQQRFTEQREDRVHWTLDQMQAYFTMCKARRPKFTQQAQDILSAYYQLQRENEHRDKARTTIRLLESLIRLAEAHAKLMYREVVLPLDAVQAVLLMEKSLVSTSSIRDCTVLQTTFPVDPEFEYTEDEDYILKMLFPEDHRRGNLDDMQFKHEPQLNVLNSLINE